MTSFNFWLNVHSKSARPVNYRDASLIRHRTSQPTPLSQKAQRHTQFISTFTQAQCTSQDSSTLLQTKNPLKYRAILAWNCIPTLQTLPSYGRKSTLFGHVVSDIHEA